ncbi:hypothetical protein KQH60_09865 [Mycetohabitans sp. B8]|uniref:hypothetical protein n=1 Tax=Mycetohabitans sp. B8 TaxID=2841845 RepID=UPI001F48396E|nr:hypothetical protein [Mycetohabitans sp. B8]MCG1042824.1 hypothetical protein [Mycetohabitans sp. B8]
MTRYSNDLVEGHVNRLKFLKRQMYGLAGFQLFRAGVLIGADGGKATSELLLTAWNDQANSVKYAGRQRRTETGPVEGKRAG